MIQKQEVSLTRDPIPSLFKRFAIPGVIGMLAVGIQSIIDGLIVGNFLGPNALAGVSLVLPLYSFIGALALVIGVGSQTLVSVGQGKGDYDSAQNSMTTGLKAIALFCLIATVVFLLWSKESVYLLGANSVLEPYSIGYIRGLFPFLIVIGVAFYNDWMLKAMGHPRLSMVLMATSVILNIVLNLFFVAVCNLGTFGVGLGTGLAFTLAVGMSTYILQFKESKIKLLRGKFKLRLLWKMLYNGSSEGVSEFATGVTILLFNITLMKYLGESGVAAFTIINYMYFLGILTLLGVSAGIIPIIGQNFGAKFYHRCKAVFRLAVLVNGVIGLVIAVILMFFSPFIIEAFLDSKEQEVINIASAGAKIYAIAFLLTGFNVLCASFFTAVTDAKRSIIISGLRGILFMSIGITMIPLVLGIDYIWYAVPISEVLTLCVSVPLIYNLFKRWKLISNKEIR